MGASWIFSWIGLDLSFHYLAQGGPPDKKGGGDDNGRGDGKRSSLPSTSGSNVNLGNLMNLRKPELAFLVCGLVNGREPPSMPEFRQEQRQILWDIQVQNARASARAHSSNASIAPPSAGLTAGGRGDGSCSTALPSTASATDVATIAASAAASAAAYAATAAIEALHQSLPPSDASQAGKGKGHGKGDVWFDAWGNQWDRKF